MKRLVLVMIIACLAAGTVFAQNWGNPWGTPAQTVSVTGTLQLQNGVIVLTSGSTVYFVPDLTRYVGFIDGLREGAQISVDGYASGNYIQPIRITVSGRAYDFTSTYAQGYGYCGGYGAGYGYGGCGGYGRGPAWSNYNSGFMRRR